MQSDLPKTINEALKILAYNDYFWSKDPKSPKTKINPHHKDMETVVSLAEAQYAWTEKQAKLALVILKRYLTKFQANGMDIKSLLDQPVYEQPFRVIDFEKSIEKYIDEDEVQKIELRFPYNKKIIQLVRMLNNKRGLPTGYSRYDGETKKWTFKQTDITTYYLTLIAIRYDFKFVDKTLLDDFYKVREGIELFKPTSASIKDNQVVLHDAPDSLSEYWQREIEALPLIQQIDKLKECGISNKGLKVKSWSNLGGRIAVTKTKKAWIDKKQVSKDQVLAGLTELNCFPIIMPVAGEPYTQHDADDWSQWLNAFQRHGIENKNMSFGFDIKEPIRSGERENPIIEDWTNEINETRFGVLMEVHQLSKQFKYVDQQTKVIFVRNRIPRTLMRSGIKPKCVLVALGGGYYAAGTDNLKRYLDSLPKTLYYNEHQPSNWDWGENIIVKL